MTLKPLPQAVITAAKLRQEANRLILLADELEASIPEEERVVYKKDVVFRFGEVTQRRRRKTT